jgi:hypothetical protein
MAADVRCQVRVGRPERVLIEAVLRLRADVVVVGTLGRGGLAKAFMGSTTEALLRRHHGAALVVPARAPNPSAGWPGGSIVAAVSAGTQRQRLLASAARMAEMFGGWLSIVDPADRHSLTHLRRRRLVILPLSNGAHLRTFRQGTAAYHFVRDVNAPVLVIRTGHRAGHPVVNRRAA